MRTHRPLAILALLFVFAALGGCSDCGAVTTPTTEDASQNAGEDASFNPDEPTDTDDGAPDADNNGGVSCAAENVCGAECCSDDELCLSGGCQLPGDECSHSMQCPDHHYCEIAMGNCLPEADSECTYVPDDDAFDPVVETAWEADANSEDVPMPEYNQVMMAPAVVDITENGTPDIVFSTFQGSDYNGPSVLRAIDGRTYEPVFDLTDPDKMVEGAASVAIGDIDGDGRNEIVAVAPNADGIIAFDDHTTDWEVKWRQPGFNTSWDGAYLADLDANGDVEVVIANRVFDGATGEQLCVNDEVGSAPNNSITADLDGNGSLEVIASNGAFKFERNPDGSVDCPTYWTFDVGAGGFPGVGDFGTFDGDDHQFGQFDGRPEVVMINLSADRTVQLFDGRTGEEIWARPMPTEDHPHISPTDCINRSGGGPPTVADFDGNGYPDIATAGACYYAIFDMHGELLWKEPTQDLSSRVTGSSVFDFQGNGRAEAVYADECFLRVYDGTGNPDGTTDELFKIANTTGTTRELPVIVDVDADFHADIVLIGNDYSSGITSQCSSKWEDFEELGGESRGIRVVRDSENRWVSTRRVWNQHAYSVTNVCDGIDDSLCPGTDNHPGAIPSGRVDNWQVDHLNNYRQNVQGEGLFEAPDLTISDISSACSEEGILLQITISNQGSRGVVEGLDVAVFAEVDGEESLLAVLQTTEMLPPGGKETLTYMWEDAPLTPGDPGTVEVTAIANDDGDGNRQYRECDETNNEMVATIGCLCETNDDCQEGYYCHESGECRPIEM